MKKPKYRDADCCRNCKFADIDVFGKGTIGYKCTKYNTRCSKFKVCDSYVWEYEDEWDTASMEAAALHPTPTSNQERDLQFFLTFARDEAAKAIGRKIIEEDMRRALGILKTEGQR